MNFEIFVTRECNFRCSYCYYDFQPVSISYDTADKLIAFIVSFKEEITLTFRGGEPFLQFSLIDYITRTLLRKSVLISSIHLVTNGSIFTDLIKQYLSDFSSIISLGISFDPDAAEHKRLRTYVEGEDSYADVCANILLMKSIIPQLRAETRFGDKIDYAMFFNGLERLGIHYVNIFPLDSAQVSIEKQREVLEKLFDYYVQHYFLKGKFLIVYPFFSYYNRKHCSCTKHLDTLVITEDGSLFSCYFFAVAQQFRIGTIFDGVDKAQYSFLQYRINSVDFSQYYCLGEYYIAQQNPSYASHRRVLFAKKDFLIALAHVVLTNPDKIHPHVLDFFKKQYSTLNH